MKGQINGEEKKEFFSPINTELGVINIFARHVKLFKAQNAPNS